MTTSVILILFCFAFLATFVQRVSGFGFGILFVSCATFFIPSHGETTALAGMLAIFCAMYTGLQFYKYLNWKKLAFILSTFLIVSFFAVRLVAVMDAALMKKVLGAVLVLVSLYFVFASGRIHLKPTAAVQVSMGTISGLMGGMFGMQGPPAVLYFISATDSKEEYMALCQWYFIIGNIAMTIYRSGNGFVTPDVLKAFLWCLPAIPLGLWMGTKVYDRIPVAVLKKIVYCFIGLAGLVTIFVK